MNKRLLMSALMAMVLAACSSKAVKDTPAPAVEDKSPTTQSAPAAATDSAATSGASQSDMSVNPLKDPNNILSKRSVYFDFDKDEVKAEYRPLVDAHAKYLLANGNAKVVLQGNTDERGSREYNLSLGQRRAVAVKKVMNLAGVQDKQIETVSFGEEKVTGVNDKDRRVDVVYDGE
ncbi:MAG: OmpA family protein [Methylophilaceae bacterium]